ncbi:MAG: hypothetical protein IJ392_04545 [Clostridia bacterium]|nr:hypothetical protein [Clostridia bacterium]
MKKLLCLIAAFLLMSVSAYAEFDLSAMSPDELQQLITQAQTQLELAEDKLVSQAIDLLKEYWRTEVFAPGKYISNDARGYLEIINTNVTYIKRDFATQDLFANETETIFRDVYCVIDFVLLSDYYGSAPYYSNINMYNCVVVHLDGTMEISKLPLFDLYRSRSFNTDFSPIIESVHSLGSAYDAVFYLLEE